MHYILVFVTHVCVCMYSFVVLILPHIFRNSGVSVQDPFSESSDPAFQKRGPMHGGVSGDATSRMQFDTSKDPYGTARKGVLLLQLPHMGLVSRFFCLLTVASLCLPFFSGA